MLTYIHRYIHVTYSTKNYNNTKQEEKWIRNETIEYEKFSKRERERERERETDRQIDSQREGIKRKCALEKIRKTMTKRDRRDSRGEKGEESETFCKRDYN